MKLGTVHQVHMFTKPSRKVGGEVCLLDFLLYSELGSQGLNSMGGKMHSLPLPPIHPNSWPPGGCEWDLHTQVTRDFSHHPCLVGNQGPPLTSLVSFT